MRPVHGRGQSRNRAGGGIRGKCVGAELVARAAAAQRLPVIHISTDYVFDGTKIGAYVETDPIAPLGVYGRTKAEGEARVREKNRAISSCARPGLWPFGANFLKTILRLSRERENCALWRSIWLPNGDPGFGGSHFCHRSRVD